MWEGEEGDRVSTAIPTGSNNICLGSVSPCRLCVLTGVYCIVVSPVVCATRIHEYLLFACRNMLTKPRYWNHTTFLQTKIILNLHQILIQNQMVAVIYITYIVIILLYVVLTKDFLVLLLDIVALDVLLNILIILVITGVVIVLAVWEVVDDVNNIVQGWRRASLGWGSIAAAAASSTADRNIT